MITAEITYNLDRLAVACKLYGEASGKSEDEVVTKQAGKLAWAIYFGMRRIMPAKGAVRAERLAALKAGQGVHVRQSVYDEIGEKYGALPIAEGKALFRRRGEIVGSVDRKGATLNLQALAVEKELNLRERARGFSAYATPRPDRDYANAVAVSGERGLLSRYGFVLSRYKLELGANVEHKYAELKWVGAKVSEFETAADVISKPKQQAIVNEAIEGATRDIMDYVKRKQAENIEKFFGA